MTRRLLDFDPMTGMVTYHDYDALSDETTVSYEQDCQPFIEANKVLQNLPEGYVSNAREFRRAASIPNAIIMKWRTEEGIDVLDPADWSAVRRKLNDPDWRHLRTGPGRL